MPDKPTYEPEMTGNPCEECGYEVHPDDCPIKLTAEVERLKAENEKLREVGQVVDRANADLLCSLSHLRQGLRENNKTNASLRALRALLAEMTDGLETIAVRACEQMAINGHLCTERAKRTGGDCGVCIARSLLTRARKVLGGGEARGNDHGLYKRWHGYDRAK